MILLGDCLERLKELEANSVDSVVTDPPYGLKFMGKKWDYDVPSKEVWLEVFRVIKPGGHLLSFGGTRTYHHLAMAIDLAGFEIRDQLQWLYGSGFPKSRDISKAIDKQLGVKREVIGTQDVGPDMRGSNFENAEGRMIAEITEPSSEEAKRYKGFGTALKPANEPIVLARKPLEKGLTVAENVLKWGTGGLNIDASRIGAGTASASKSVWEQEDGHSNLNVDHAANGAKKDSPAIKGFTATKSVAQTTSEKESVAPDDTCKKDTSCSLGLSQVEPNINQTEFSDLNTELCGKNISAKSQKAKSSITKTASRPTIESKISNSFQEATTADCTPNKATLNDPMKQNEKSAPQGEHTSQGRWPSNLLLSETAAQMLDEQSGTLKSGGGDKGNKTIGAQGYGSNVSTFEHEYKSDSGGASRFFYVAKASKRERNAGLGEQSNGHPTVKPIKLMEYLCKLITPPGGLILDPFCGSGSTLVAAKRLGFEAIGIEMNEEYCAIAEKRIAHASSDE